MTCPYQPCGGNENCIGCCEDPQHRPMSLPELYDACPVIGCNDCIRYKPTADLPWEESTCKRLDHKHVKFYTSPFKSYDCDGPICQDFQPNGLNKWLARHWSPDFLKSWVGEYEAERPINRYVALILDGDRKVMYHVRYDDWFYGRFLNEDGTLKWFRKQYQRKVVRQSNDGPGFELVTELRTDGF